MKYFIPAADTLTALGEISVKVMLVAAVALVFCPLIAMKAERFFSPERAQRISRGVKVLAGVLAAVFVVSGGVWFKSMNSQPNLADSISEKTNVSITQTSENDDNGREGGETYLIDGVECIHDPAALEVSTGESTSGLVLECDEEIPAFDGVFETVQDAD